jgi:hypothetical protein
VIELLRISVLGSLLVSELDDLLLEDGRLGETEGDLVGGQLVVAVDDGIELVFHNLVVERIKENDLLSSAISLNTGGSFLDVGRVENIGEDFFMNSDEVSRSWSHLSSMTLGSWRLDVSVGDNDNLFAEFGLKFFLDNGTNLSESTERTVRNTDEKVVSSGAITLVIFNLLNRVQEDNLEVAVMVWELSAKSVEALGNFFFKFRRLLTVFLNDSISFMEHVCILVSQICCLFVC